MQSRRAGTHKITTLASELAEPTTALSWRSILIAFLVCLISGAQTVFRPNGAPTTTSLVMFGVYALSCLLLSPLMYVSAPMMIVAIVATNLAIGLALSLGSTTLLGALTLELLAVVVLYRLPPRWSLPSAAVAAIFFLGTQYWHFFLVTTSSSANGDFWKLVIPFLVIPGIAVALRSHALIIQQLRATQAQLEAEMERTAELAVARERARIARDMHDVLAHSLTVLTIQAQAARQHGLI